ncbi:MAG: hypothetical protein EAZ47_11270 [Bacteroidetes bacterium]|nr:MAG: hypothetical protein EAY72_02525 [Bacteroidota bacterium]TAE72569.1 MAG: hypothetical protein EAY68_00950 [Bacteroidota bacterium]TAF90274.1 MAG: hypothetical protein EAZ47_11270 [Bacteroidota bacterium]
MAKLFFCLALWCCGLVGYAQTADSIPNIPLMRKIFHEKIDAHKPTIEQFLPADTTSVAHIFQFQAFFERDTALTNNQKISYLRGLEDVLSKYITDVKTRRIAAKDLPTLLNAFAEAIPLQQTAASLEPVIEANTIAIGNILLSSYCFADNASVPKCKEILLYKECVANKDRILPVLSRNPSVYFASDLLPIAAKHNPDVFYNFAAATDALGGLIRNSTDSLVRTIVSMAKFKRGRLYFPMLDRVYQNQLSIATIDSISQDSIAYYKLLVETAIQYANRMRKQDTPLVYNALQTRLKIQAKETFINTINALHDESDAVRFNILQSLTPQQLYYLCVQGEEEIYTSSYLGVFKAIFGTKKPITGDELLMSVRFDHFKKWIKMAAGYNTLDAFLATMKPGNADVLLQAFVNGLDKTNSLEDAVDVADSYGSIANLAIQKQILATVQQNYEQALLTNNERGKKLYYILQTIFASSDTSMRINLTEKLGIPPVYTMPQKLLTDTVKKQIVIQQFFYGDKDGMNIYSAFLNHFRNGNWRIVQNDDFATVTSIKGTPIVIYANKPLDETQNLDALAQQRMNSYLQENGIEPTVVIHRGHSYFLRSTLQQLVPSAKVVLLGSCGGYNNLNEVLKICPEAHIIASKQVGTGLINQGLINNICEDLRQGKDLYWPGLWKQLSKTFANNEMFNDYVPPHKNLGAIFMMAYNR